MCKSEREQEWERELDAIRFGSCLQFIVSAVLFTWTSFYQRIQMQFIACNIRFEAIRFSLTCSSFNSVAGASFRFFTSFIVSYCWNLFWLSARVGVLFSSIFVFQFSLVSFYYSLLERTERAEYSNVLVRCVAVSQHLIYTFFSICRFFHDEYSQTQTQHTHTHSKKHGTWW